MDKLELYKELMEEVKLRLKCLEHAAAGRTGLPAPIVREFMYQQMRFLCELIALSCLVAHGDMTSLQFRPIRRSSSADGILKQMESLRPNFYPIAVKQTVVEPSGGPRRIELKLMNLSPLPKEKLAEIYQKIHRHLHRGSLEALLSSAETLDSTVNLPEIFADAQKMYDLLKQHVISINNHEMIVCFLRNADDQERVQVALTKTVELSFE